MNPPIIKTVILVLVSLFYLPQVKVIKANQVGDSGTLFYMIKHAYSTVHVVIKQVSFSFPSFFKFPEHISFVQKGRAISTYPKKWVL